MIKNASHYSRPRSTKHDSLSLNDDFQTFITKYFFEYIANLSIMYAIQTT
mgnify:FL=1